MGSLFSKKPQPLREGSFEARQARDDALVIELSGALDEKTPGLPEQLEKTVADAIDQGIRLIVINGKSLQAIDFACLSALFSHLMRVQMRGGNLVFCSLDRPMRELVFNHFDLPAGHAKSEKKALRTVLGAPAPEHWWFWKWDSPLYVETRARGEVTVFEMKGALWNDKDAELLDSMLVKCETSKVVFDMTRLVTVGVDAMKPLVLLRGGEQKEAAWAGVGMLTRCLLQTTGLASLFPHYESLEAAVHSLK